MASIDIKDAYLHVPIHPTHQKFLRFAVEHRHFQFVALPFGLATVPQGIYNGSGPSVSKAEGSGHSGDDLSR